MVGIEDVWTAIDRGYEQIAVFQFEIAEKLPMIGDISVFNGRQVISMELLAYLEALEELSLNHSIAENKIIDRLYNNIKVLTKNIQ